MDNDNGAPPEGEAKTLTIEERVTQLEHSVFELSENTKRLAQVVNSFNEKTLNNLDSMADNQAKTCQAIHNLGSLVRQHDNAIRQLTNIR